MQSASAAMLELTELFGNGTSTGSGTNSVIGSTIDDATYPDNVTVWSLKLSDLGPSGLADLKFTFSANYLTFPTIKFDGNNDLKNLVADTYNLMFIPPANIANYQYEFTFTATDVSQVPVPAAAWLFGSALLGLIGFTSRKQQPMLAA